MTPEDRKLQREAVRTAVGMARAAYAGDQHAFEMLFNGTADRATQDAVVWELANLVTVAGRAVATAAGVVADLDSFFAGLTVKLAE